MIRVRYDGWSSWGSGQGMHRGTSSCHWRPTCPGEMLPRPCCRDRPGRRRRFRWVLCCLAEHCRRSDPLWEAYSEARTPLVRWMLWPVLRAAQAVAILPPPPGRLRSLQAAAALAVACWANAVAWRVYLQHALDVLDSGFHLALHAYLVENLLETLQPPIILLTTWCNLGRLAPSLGRVLSGAAPRVGPVSAPRSFLALTVLLYTAHAAGQALFHVTILRHREDYICYSVAAAWSASQALVMDRLVALALTLAALKIRTVNRRLGSLRAAGCPAGAHAPPVARASSASWMPQPEATLDPAVQRGLLQTVAKRWETTVEQVDALLGHGMLGLPLLYSLLHITIGLITAFSLVIRDETQSDVRHVKLIHVTIYLSRVASLALTAGWLFREAKMTEAVIGALDTTAWPIRERQRVNHLLHLSRGTERFRVCGIVSIDHSLLFTVMGNTATYMMMLVQYPILTPGKAAAALNQTESKAAATVP